MGFIRPFDLGGDTLKDVLLVTIGAVDVSGRMLKIIIEAAGFVPCGFCFNCF